MCSLSDSCLRIPDEGDDIVATVSIEVTDGTHFTSDAPSLPR
jgi:hypothetical protein